MTDVAGSVEPGWEKVADAFRANFDEGKELGAAVAVYQHGKPVVDLWAGVADRTTGENLGRLRFLDAEPKVGEKIRVRVDPRGWFNPRAFLLPARGTLGNLGRNALIGPNYRTFDFSISKNTRVRALGEAGNVQFRAEAFNLGNRANFRLAPPALQAFPGAAAGETVLSTFGVVRETIPTSRQIQFGLRLVF